jgi:predicted amidophosphoribosyltransferase
MSLVSCPECGRSVSTSANSCPGCGHPLHQAGEPPTGWIGKAAAVLGAWLTAPWVARLLAFVAACVVAIVMVRSGR